MDCLDRRPALFTFALDKFFPSRKAPPLWGAFCLLTLVMNYNFGLVGRT